MTSSEEETIVINEDPEINLPPWKKTKDLGCCEPQVHGPEAKANAPPIGSCWLAGATATRLAICGMDNDALGQRHRTSNGGVEIGYEPEKMEFEETRSLPHQGNSRGRALPHAGHGVGNGSLLPLEPK